MRALGITVIVVSLSPATVFAGQAKSAPAPKTPATQPAVAAPAPPAAPQPPENYTYQSEGRRDPFTSLLLGSGAESRVTGASKSEGPGGLSVSEISVRGIMQSRDEMVAMVQGADNKTYIVHPGDKFLDGTIKTITPQGLVVVQEVNDPLSLVKQREVRKLLRSAEDAKK